MGAVRAFVARFIKEPSRPLFLVDVNQQIAVQLPPSGNIKFTTKAEAWEKGKIYVPPGAKIVSAGSEAEALNLVIDELQPKIEAVAMV
tara:strand:- start:6235 stop:6498 length:264 start_codon:yes stop_codon:yes gene_type:complete